MPTLKAAHQHSSLALPHLPRLAASDEPNTLYQRFTCALRPYGAYGPWRLLRVCFFSSQRAIFIQCCMAGWLFLGCMFADPILLHLLLTDFDHKQASVFAAMPTLRNLGLALALAVSMLLRTTCMELCFFASTRCANNARSSLIIGVFRSSLSALSGRVGGSAGSLTNLLATDADRIGNAVALIWSFSQWTFSVCALPMVVYLMWELLGSAAFVGAGAYIVSTALAAMLSWLQQPIVHRLQELRDARGELMGDLAKGVGMLKAYCCELTWQGRVTHARRKELKQLKKLRYLDAATSLLCGVFAQSAPIAIFSWYILVQGHSLDASTAFTALAWIFQMAWSISALPDLFLQLWSLLPNLRRLADAIATTAPSGIDSLHRQLDGMMQGMIEPSAGREDSQYHDVTPRPTVPSIDDSMLFDESGGDGLPTPGSINSAAARVPWSNRTTSGGVAPSRHAPSGATLVDPLVADTPPPPPGTVASLRSARFLPPAHTAECAHERARGRDRQFGEVDLTVKSGELLLVCGAIGSGKSTLLSAISRARPLKSGVLLATPRRAYCAQRPFLLRESVRDNITFGQRFEPARYAEALKLSALDVDMKQLAAGDLTQVGEAGVALSEGQKARVAFARAVYSDPEFLVLDDIFAALDAHTGAQLWESVKLLQRREKSIVIATHQVSLLSHPEVSRIALMRDGVLTACAPPAEPQMAMQLRGYMAAAAAMKQAGKLPKPQQRDRASGVAGARVASVATSGIGLSVEACERVLRTTLRRLEGQRIDDSLITRACAAIRGEESADDQQTAELTREGLISFADFSLYLSDFGTSLTLAILALVTVISALFSIAANVFLAHWTGGEQPNATQTPADVDMPFGLGVSAAVGYAPFGVHGLGGGPAEATDRDRDSLVIYIALSFGTELLNAIQAVLLTWCSLRASERVHARLLERLLHAPLSFYDGTTTGAILNRCLSDMQNVDMTVPDSLLSLAEQVLQMCTQIGLVLYFAPWVALAILPLVAVYTQIYRRVRFAARDARRLSARLHSPVFSHFVDVLSGRETIAAFGAEEDFCEANALHVSAMSRASIAVEGILKWAQALSVQSGSLLYFVCAVVCVLLHSSGALNTSELGLVLLYANNLQRASMDLLMRLAALETEFVAVERIAEYSRIESEHELPSGSVQAAGTAMRPTGDPTERAALDASSWMSGAVPNTLQVGTDADFYTRELMGGDEPLRGAIELRDVVLRYAAHKPPVLTRLTVSIPPGSKIACVGRSGCGKSSLLRAISRFYPLDAGSIRLDGVDLATLPIKEVRSVARYVAAEPIMLGGTLLTNLLAYESLERATRATDAGECGNAHTVAEHEAWAALESVGLRARIEALPRKLQTPARSVDLSAGERQLFSITRALVAGRGPRALRALLCDEPTSALDAASDHRVHNVLTSLSCTVLVVAHRLETLSRFDRVLVMDSGALVEQGTPAELEAKPHSVLSQLKAVQE
jgi:ATP-binding cassette subfamily C (CFTR/MRP) protein 1